MRRARECARAIREARARRRLGDGGLHFGDDRKRDFFGRLRADREAHGRVKAFVAFAESDFVEQRAGARARTERADVHGARLEERSKRALVGVDLVVHDEADRAGARVDRAARIFERKDRVGRIREAFAPHRSRVRRADERVPAERARHRDDRHRIATATEHEEARRRCEHFDEHVEAASVDRDFANRRTRRVERIVAECNQIGAEIPCDRRVRRAFVVDDDAFADSEAWVKRAHDRRDRSAPLALDATLGRDERVGLFERRAFLKNVDRAVTSETERIARVVVHRVVRRDDGLAAAQTKNEFCGQARLRCSRHSPSPRSTRRV